jgi:hypothetical protein
MHPQTDEQMEALIGTICYAIINAHLDSKWVMENEDIHYFVHHALHRPNLEYFVAGVLFIISKYFVFHGDGDLYGQSVYNMLVYFTRKHDPQSPTIWPTVLICAWNKYFCDTPTKNDRTQFCSDIQLVKKYLQLYECGHKNIVSTTQNSLNMHVRPGLCNILLPDEMIIDVAYRLFEWRKTLRIATVIFWPFLITLNGKIISRQNFKLEISKLRKVMQYNHIIYYISL